MGLINKYRMYKNVYVVGNTNAGKSTLINKIIDNYSIDKSLITISNMPSTTLDQIKIPIKDYILIDILGRFSFYKQFHAENVLPMNFY